MIRPTLEDVAREAGVSRATVSRVVRKDPSVADKTVDRVQEAVKALGYIPNAAARTLASGTHNTIAVVVPEPDERIFADPFFGLTISGISTRLKTTPFQLVMVFATSPGTSATKDFLLAGGVAGAIVVSHHRTDGLAAAVSSMELPSVFVGAPLHKETLTEPVHIVDADNFAGGQVAAQRLLARGVKHPASIAGPLDMTAAVKRLQGWQEVVEAAGLSPVIVEGDFTMGSGRKVAAQLLDEHPEIDGIFVGSDLMAAGALDELRARGIEPGREIQVVSFDDFDLAAQYDLTTVKNPAVELGAEAANMLVSLISGPQPPSERVILPVTLTARSTG